MSLWRYFGLAIVGLWLVGAVVYALSDVDVMLDPVSRRAQHLCADDSLRDVTHLNADLSDKECLPRLARRGALDVVIVAVPVMLGLSLIPRRNRAGTRRVHGVRRPASGPRLGGRAPLRRIP